MMDYTHEILTAMVDRYERRKGTSAQNGKPQRAVTFDLAKHYPIYRDHLSEEEQAIDDAVTRLSSWQMVAAPRSAQGYYTKITLRLDHIQEIYEFLGRKPAQETRQEQLQLLLDAQRQNPDTLSSRFAGELMAALQAGRSPGYGLQGNVEKLRDVLLALEKIGQLNKETYVRNFSEAVFHDSKHFHSISGIIRSILSDLTDQPVEKKQILEYYNLLENPTYLYLKGGWILEFPDSCIRVTDLPGGIGLTSDGLSAIRSVLLEPRTVITVENLTTYHDIPSDDRAVLYLGGFPNSARASFLRMVYASKPDAVYLHYGDLDPYGLLILENLKQKTGIPFAASGMDLATLQACFQAGHYRPLTAEDRKVMQSPMLCAYREIFAFMQAHNCKAEQESLSAMKL